MVKSNYLFHFIISKTMDSSINYLKKVLNFDSSRDLIEYMLGLISKNIHYIKKIIGDHQSEYVFIDNEDPTRIDKYVRLKAEKYKMLKKWHYKYNEYGMSVILRDIIRFFYEGIVKYGAEKFVEMISKKLNIEKIKQDFSVIKTHMMKLSSKKYILFSNILKNIPTYV